MNLRSLLTAAILIEGSLAGNDQARCVLIPAWGDGCFWYFSNGGSKKIESSDIAAGCRSIPSLPIREFCFDPYEKRAHFYWGEGPNQDEKRCMNYGSNIGGAYNEWWFTETPCTW